MRNFARATVPTTQAELYPRLDTGRPVLLVGSGPSTEDFDPARVPPNAYVVRMNTFVVEPDYRFGRHVDALFWAVPRRWLMHAYALAKSQAWYDIDLFVTTVRLDDDILPFFESESRQWRETLKPRLNHHSLLRSVPGIGAYFGNRRTRRNVRLPTQSFQAIALLLALGFRRFYVIGVDLYAGSTTRYAFEYPDFIKQVMAPQHYSGGFETAAHDLESDLAFFEVLRQAFPDARFFSLTHQSTFASLVPVAPILDLHWNPDQTGGRDKTQLLKALEAELFREPGPWGEALFVDAERLLVWRWDPAHPEQVQEADVLLDGEHVATVRLDESHDLLEWGGCGRGACGALRALKKLTGNRFGLRLGFRCQATGETFATLHLFGRRRPSNTGVPHARIAGSGTVYQVHVTYPDRSRSLHVTVGNATVTKNSLTCLMRWSDETGSSGEEIYQVAVDGAVRDGIEALAVVAWFRERYPAVDLTVDSLYAAARPENLEAMAALTGWLIAGKVSLAKPELVEDTIVETHIRTTPVLFLSTRSLIEVTSSWLGLSALAAHGHGFLSRITIIANDTPAAVRETMFSLYRDTRMIVVVDGPDALGHYAGFIQARTKASPETNLVVQWDDFSGVRSLLSFLGGLQLRSPVLHAVPTRVFARLLASELPATGHAVLMTPLVTPAHRVPSAKPLRTDNGVPSLVLMFDEFDSAQHVEDCLRRAASYVLGAAPIIGIYRGAPVLLESAGFELPMGTAIVDDLESTEPLARGSRIVHAGQGLVPDVAVLHLLSEQIPLWSLDSATASEWLPDDHCFSSVEACARAFLQLGAADALAERPRVFQRKVDEVATRLVGAVFGAIGLKSMDRWLSKKNGEGPAAAWTSDQLRLLTVPREQFKIGLVGPAATRQGDVLTASVAYTVDLPFELAEEDLAALELTLSVDTNEELTEGESTSVRRIGARRGVAQFRLSMPAQGSSCDIRARVKLGSIVLSEAAVMCALEPR